MDKSLEGLQKMLEQVRSSEPGPPIAPVGQVQNADRRLGTARIDELLATYETGLSEQVVGKQFGIGAASIMPIVRRHGVTVHDSGLSPADVQEAAELCATGLSLQPVADRFGFNKSTVRRALLDAGIQRRAPKHP